MKKLLSSYSKLVSEWHPTLNGDEKPEDFPYSSTQKKWWLCPTCGEDYDMVITSRTRKLQPQACPFCSGKRVGKKNNLLFVYPDVAKDWHPTKNGNLLPENVSYGSNQKVWWLCPNGHEYLKKVKERTRKASRESITRGCSYCRGLKVSSENSFLVNFPQIAKEWHPTKNGDLRVEDFTSGSNKKVWWLCPRGHDYDSQIVDRTGKNTGCTYCTNQTSRPEVRILAEFRYLFDEVITRYKIDGVEIDIYLPNINLAVEYDGSFFHRGKESKDLEKNKFIESRDIRIIRVRHHPLKQISTNDIVVESDELLKSDLDKILLKVKTFVQTDTARKIDAYLKKEDFLDEEMFLVYVSYFPNPLPEKSLLHTHPDISKEWDFERNAPLRPENFTHGSNVLIWWVCPNSHKYKATIGNRTSDHHPGGCPECSGRKVGEDNNLLVRFPKIAMEWHPTKNGNKEPQDVMPGSTTKFWWLCPTCGEDYDMSGNMRTHKTKPQGCPYCGGNRTGLKNSLSYLLPDVAAEWHPTKNGDEKPENYRSRSHHEVWWLCRNGHEYFKKISTRTRKSSLKSESRGCPKCYEIWKKKWCADLHLIKNT